MAGGTQAERSLARHGDVRIANERDFDSVRVRVMQ